MVFLHFHQSLLRVSADSLLGQRDPKLRPLGPAWPCLPGAFGMHPSMDIFSLSTLKIFCIIALSSRNNRFNTASTP